MFSRSTRIRNQIVPVGGGAVSVLSGGGTPVTTTPTQPAHPAAVASRYPAYGYGYRGYYGGYYPPCFPTPWGCYYSPTWFGGWRSRYPYGYGYAYPGYQTPVIAAVS